jgi:hypothetical protein
MSIPREADVNSTKSLFRQGRGRRIRRFYKALARSVARACPEKKSVSREENKSDGRALYLPVMKVEIFRANVILVIYNGIGKNGGQYNGNNVYNTSVDL